MSRRRIDSHGITDEQVDEVARAICVMMDEYGITSIDSMPSHLNMFYQSENFPDGRMIEKK